jgi:hypothetical protein
MTKKIELFESFMEKQISSSALTVGQLAQRFGMSYRRMHELREKGTYIDESGCLYRRTGVYIRIKSPSKKHICRGSTATLLRDFVRGLPITVSALGKLSGVKHRSTFKAIVDQEGALIVGNTGEIITRKKQSVKRE